MSFQKSHVIIVGCGFLGKAAAQLFTSKGHPVLGIVRHARNGVACTQETALSLLPCDVTNRAAVQMLSPQIPPEALFIYCVSSQGKSDAYGPVYRDGLRHVLESWKPQRLLFVSSTSVYAQTQGETVTESSSAQPVRETGRILLEAESVTLDAGGLVARLSGIYGPGRSILLKKFLTGEALLENGGHRLINQIHRDDAAQALVHLITTPTTAGIYNVSDNTPATQRDVYQWIAEALHKPLPAEGPADPQRKRGTTSKRVSNKKLCDTGWKPYFPSYREALPMLIAA